MTIIYTRALCKAYRRFEKDPGLFGSVKSLFHRRYIYKTAVSALDLDIAEGEFVGLIGPNGAGKTTIAKMLSGIIAPSSGEISVMGFYPNRLENAFKRQYSIVMGQKSALFFELTAADTFTLYKEMYSIPDAVYAKNLRDFVDLFDVASLLNVQVRTLSLGERMKMELICALLHAPRVLFLDEPTIGLDAVAQKQLRLFLRNVNRERGTTILLTSHYMDDIRSLCHRGIVINHGEKLYDGGIDELFSRYQTHRRVSVLFDERNGWVPRGVDVIEDSEFKSVFLCPHEAVQPMLRELLTSTRVSDIAVEEDDIANVVERIYGDTVGARVC